jgi:iron complex outermembrane receptor protein
MVSSISLRGTGASRTGIYWNGIPINSSLNGQTDFNTLFANGFDNVEIRRGGGSVLLGSGAIGGAINLSDQVLFNSDKNGNILLGIGSYTTINTQLTGKFSTDKLYAKISFGAFSSKNDYAYLGTNIKNENGEFKNYNFNGVFAYKLNEKNIINFYTTVFDSDRNTSRTLTATSNAKLLDYNNRFLLDWKLLGNQLTSSFKIAYLYEKNTYFFNQDQPDFSESLSNKVIGKYDFTYFLNNQISFNAGAQFDNVRGHGTNISETVQNDFTSYFLFHHQPIPLANYNVSIRKGISNQYEIPFIYAFDFNFDLLNQLILKGNYSTNYRLPTINDLYWEPGGNPNLIPETSTTFELGLQYTRTIFKFNATTFLIKSKNLIQWQPISANLWQPINIQSVKNYGMELSAALHKKINVHLIDFKIQYDYVHALDQNLNKQLIYVPNHKANSIFNYQYKKWGFVYNLQYTGKVYTTTSNTQSLNAYTLSNISLTRSLLKNKLLLAFKVNNLFDEKYQSVAYRPMPNRNFTLNINLII